MAVTMGTRATIYVAVSACRTGVKIGITGQDAQKRIRNLAEEAPSGLRMPLELLTSFRGSTKDEAEIHRALRAFRLDVRPHREWYRAPVDVSTLRRVRSVSGVIRAVQRASGA